MHSERRRITTFSATRSLRRSGPAAASGDTSVPSGPAGTGASTAGPESDRELSEGPNSVRDAETSLGGADSVPSTPDDVPENYT